jgi:hypothetical protein
VAVVGFRVRRCEAAACLCRPALHFCRRGQHVKWLLTVLFCRFQDRQVVAANLRLASESPLLVQARRIALGDRTPVVLANLGSDRYHPESLASERPVLVVRWGITLHWQSL